tara:strand:+ start:8234 stop:9004 length:771 start_codon:yes stop_codon:yes gene_type:complete
MNPKTCFLFPYKPGSNSGRELARALEVKRISHKNSRFRGRPEKIVINWGASRVPEEVAKCALINNPENVKRASDKLKFFENAECRKPEWFTHAQIASEYGEENGVTIVARHVLNGNSGEGIELIEPGEYMPYAPLYTAYMPKKNEYRVHVFRGQVIDVQRKARKREVPDDEVNWKIRNNANGFIFARNGDALGDIPPDVLDQAVQAVQSLGLDFGAADVIFNERQSLAYVLEVNTAPGLEGTTLTNYTAAFNALRE